MGLSKLKMGLSTGGWFEYRKLEAIRDCIYHAYGLCIKELCFSHGSLQLTRTKTSVSVDC